MAEYPVEAADDDEASAVEVTRSALVDSTVEYPVDVASTIVDSVAEYPDEAEDVEPYDDEVASAVADSTEEVVAASTWVDAAVSYPVAVEVAPAMDDAAVE
jgi:hypothetical protein